MRPDSKDAQLALIDLALARGEIELARDQCADALRISPNDLRIRRKEARILQELGHVDEAFNILRAVIDEAQDDPAPRKQLADLLHATGDTRAAEVVYREILTMRPNNRDAHLALIDLALARGEIELARGRCADALRQLPKDQGIRRKQARILQELGHVDEAFNILRAVIDEAQDDPAPRKQLADLLHATGDTRAAEVVYREILAMRPNNRDAHLALIDLALAGGEIDRARGRCADALRQLPKDQRIRRKQARVLQELGDPEDAIRILRAVIDEAQDDPAPRKQLADLLHATGDTRAAEVVYREILAMRPNNRDAHLALIDLALAGGEIDRARDLCAHVLQLLPGDPRVRRKQARVLQELGHTDESIGMLRAIIEEAGDDPAPRKQLADLLHSTGDTRTAEVLYREILAMRPDNRDVGFALVDIALFRDGPRAALELFESLFDPWIREVEGRDALDPKLILSYCQRALQAGEDEKIKINLKIAEGFVDIYTDSQLARLANTAEIAGDHAVAATALTAAITRETMSLATGIYLLRRFYSSVDTQQVEQLAGVIEARLPPSQRPRFQIETAALCGGPEAALVVARRVTGKARQASGATIVAERVLATGKTQLAYRYCRRCLRRWEGSPAIQEAFFEALMSAGCVEEASVFLAGLDARGTSIDLGRLRFRLLIELGVHDGALALARERQAAGRKLSPDLLLRTCIFSGHLDAAREVVSRSTAFMQNRIKHYRASHLGSLINEMEILKYIDDAEQGTASYDLTAANRHSSNNFFHPAKFVLDEYEKRERLVRDAGPVIPKNIFQFWDVKNAPEQVVAVMNTWRDRPGFNYRCLDQYQAIDFLGQAFGREHVRAFRLANHIAEKCDFLRLCLLYSEGGIYADADDRLLGDPDCLVEGTGDIALFREPFGAIANNVICAPPGHPVLEIAIEKTCRSLLARENDSTWLKTGPGLLTRAAAVHVLNAWAAGEEPRIKIEPFHRLRRLVCPHVQLSYKSTARYWNPRVRAVSQPIASILKSAFPPV